MATAMAVSRVAGCYIATVTDTLLLEAVAAAQERDRARDLWATAEELLAELEEQLEAEPG
jgi:hypothetical protein